MDTRRHFAERHPYIFLVMMILSIAVVQALVLGITKLLNIGDLRFFYLASDIILAAIGAIIISGKKWWTAIGFRKAKSGWHFWFFLVPLLPVFENVSAGVNVTSLYDAALFFVLALVVGFFEESYFRGLMLRPIALLGKWRAAIITAVVFGLMHSLNLLSGFNPQVVFVQMSYASAIGFTYAALVLRTGMIWPLMLLHFLTDFTGFMALGQLMQAQTGSVSIVVSAIYVVVFVGYGIFLLWRIKPVL